MINQVKISQKKLWIFLDVLKQIPTLQEKAEEILKVYYKVIVYRIIKLITINLFLYRMESLPVKSWKEE